MKIMDTGEATGSTAAASVGAPSVRERVVSGIRPTGRLHVGHFHGALKNWVALQDQYECFFFCADWHAFSSEYKNPGVIAESIVPMFTDFLAAGLDPERCVLFLQSEIKEHAELHLIFSMLTPLGWLERVPTFKEQVAQLADKEISTYGFFGYPVLQTADIIIYRAHRVPVGADQVPHLEFTRELVRRFKFLFGELFPEPMPLLTETSRLLGFDGRKMSKSYGNDIKFDATDEQIRALVMPAVTDPQRVRRSDPGNPDVCNIFAFHKVYTPEAEVREIDHGCRTAGIGCVDCKRKLLGHIAHHMDPIRERRAHWSQHPQQVLEIIAAGNARARPVARETLERTRELTGLRSLPK